MTRTTSTRPRNLYTVVDRMLALIPHDEGELRRAISHAQDGMLYCPPERMGDSAVPVTLAIAGRFRAFGGDLPEWAARALAIWKAEDVEPGDYVF